MRVLAAARQQLLTSRKPTRPEIVLYAMLDDLVQQYAPDEAWERQVQLLNRWTVDAAIPGLKLVLQADGDYWHGLYEEDQSDPRVASNMRNDAHQDARLTAEGWRVVRFWERDLTGDRAACEARLTEELQNRMAEYLAELAASATAGRNKKAAHPEG
ncbi:DUF559 domain-containing protein [Actinacidiphila glaucinigra]|uniref:DUF559 domain-containing protein n=1 Tax=Actinacidiphila glaucinigra TaxID=235986 RepID=UPI0037194EEA